MKKYTVTLIPGDGTGPELVDIVKKVISYTGVNIEWEEVVAGESAIEKYQTPLPKEVLDSIKKNKVALKGPITTPIGTGFRSVNVSLRQELNLYACLRPCKIYDGVKTKFKNVDLIVVRENMEDLYCGVEFEPNSEVAYNF
jgi:isocitrate dehydrogenase (NAD+)